MTDTYTLKHSLNQKFITALTEVVKVTNALEIPYFIAGATARDIVMHGIFGHAPGRATADIDTAIFVDTWGQFEDIKASLISSGLTETDLVHRLREPKSGYPVDILPFGALEDAERRIQWPPKHEETMSVIGFKEAFDSSLQVEIDGLVFNVASLPGIALMKLIAWGERGNENSKDASDFLLLLNKYQLIHQDRIWEDYVPKEFDYDVELVTAFLLGFDVRDILKAESEEVLLSIKNEHQDRFLTAMARGNGSVNLDDLENQLNAFWRGVFDERSNTEGD
ncbi:TPA: nucleotidyl transferase AbiEii/AbiGii toxin family protein [Vibrio cholerae]